MNAPNAARPHAVRPAGNAALYAPTGMKWTGYEAFLRSRQRDIPPLVSCERCHRDADFLVMHDGEWKCSACSRPAEQGGQGLAEYSLILALIAILAIASLYFLGGQINTVLSTIGSSL